MSVHVRCERCNCSYHEVTSSEWNSWGTVTRNDGYCGSCYDNFGRRSWTWTGDVVKMCCNSCDHTYLVVTWKDWRKSGTISKTGGYCRGCYQTKRRERETMEEMKELRNQVAELVKALAHGKGVDVDKRVKEAEEKAEEKFEEERKQNTIKIQQMEQDFQIKQAQDKQEYESKMKQRDEKEKEERRQNEIKLKQTDIQSQKDVLKLKQESLMNVQQALSKIENLEKIEEGKLNQILEEVDKQTADISKKWIKLDTGINSNTNCDEKSNHDADKKNVFKKIQLLQSKLSKMRVLICIGKTGLGKSTFLNRMIGESNECKNESVTVNRDLFKVGGDVNSETSEVNHKFIKNSISNEIYCLVDTPGSLDSYGRDNEHTNNISEYLRGCGGVNTFCVFVSLCEGTIDKTYIELLQLYNNMLGENWWKHALFIGTKLDSYLAGKRKLRKKTNAEREKIVNERFNSIIKQFKDNKELNIPNELELKLIAIGHDNYKIAVKQVLSSVSENKFNCDKIVSPLNKLTTEAKKQETLVNNVKKEKDEIEVNKNKIENEIKLISQKIQHIENEIKQLQS